MKTWISAILLSIFTVAAQAADISGAGSTFVYPILSKWAQAYKAETGVSINYQSIGSGGGIKQIKAKTVNFGATDMPLSQADLDTAGLVQFPIIIGGVVPVINLPDTVLKNRVQLTGPILAKIYLGQIPILAFPGFGDQRRASF
jgi:phosphate transport system substrate-binding protein